jgi:hypothetical protein
MASKPLSFWQQWDTIVAMIAGGATIRTSDIAAALRSATPEIDNLIQLLHTPEVAFLLQSRHIERNGEVLERLLDALYSLLFAPLSVVPVSVQHYLADVIEPPARPRGRPKRPITPMRREQIEREELKKARKDVADMDELLARLGNDKAAMEAFAQRRQIDPPSARRRYRQSKRRVERADAELQQSIKLWLDAVAKRRQIFNMADALITMDSLKLDIEQRIEKLQALFPDASEEQIETAFYLAAKIRRSAWSPAK